MPADLPDFALIGAAKCGTTALAKMLARHPQLFITDPKEPGYFAGVPPFDEASYRALFDGAGDRLKGDCSTQYSRRETFPGTAERMHAACPELKVLFAIREPLARVRSHFEYRLRHGRAEGTLEQVLSNNDELARASLYSWQLEPWIERYGRERIHVLRMEDLRERSDSVLRQVFSFLEIDPRVPIANERANARPATGSERPVRVPRVVRAMGRLISPELRRRMKARLPKRKVAADELTLSAATEQVLRERFREDFAQLRQIVGPELDLYGYA